MLKLYSNLNSKILFLLTMALLWALFHPTIHLYIITRTNSKLQGRYTLLFPVFHMENFHSCPQAILLPVAAPTAGSSYWKRQKKKGEKNKLG